MMVKRQHKDKVKMTRESAVKDNTLINRRFVKQGYIMSKAIFRMPFSL